MMHGRKMSIHGPGGAKAEGRTGNILLQDIILLQHSPKQALRVLVHDEDLPFLRRIYRPDRVQEFYVLVTVVSSYTARGTYCF